MNNTFWRFSVKSMEKIIKSLKMIFVFPEFLLVKLTNPKSREVFDSRAGKVAKILGVFPLLIGCVGFLIDIFKGIVKVNDTSLSDHCIFYICLICFSLFSLFKLQFFTDNGSYFDFLSESSSKEKEYSVLFDRKNNEDFLEVTVVCFFEEYELSSESSITNLALHDFKDKRGRVVLKKGESASSRNVDTISIEKTFVSDDISNFSQDAEYRIAKVELLKEVIVSEFWNIKSKKEYRRLLLTVEGDIPREKLEKLKEKRATKEELSSLLI